MMRWILRSKLHNAIVTEANLDYVGSITIDAELLKTVGLWEGEKVLVVSNTSGARLETYVIVGAPGSREICVNGAAAHLIGRGEQVIIMGFELASAPITPKIAILDGSNTIIGMIAETAGTTSQEALGALAMPV